MSTLFEVRLLALVLLLAALIKSNFHDARFMGISSVTVSPRSCYTTQKMKFFTKDFFNKRDQIRSLLWTWSHLLQKSLMENLIFCAVLVAGSERLYSKPFLSDTKKASQHSMKTFLLALQTGISQKSS